MSELTREEIEQSVEQIIRINDGMAHYIGPGGLEVSKLAERNVAALRQLLSENKLLLEDAERWRAVVDNLKNATGCDGPIVCGERRLCVMESAFNDGKFLAITEHYTGANKTKVPGEFDTPEEALNALADMLIAQKSGEKTNAN